MIVTWLSESVTMKSSKRALATRPTQEYVEPKPIKSWYRCCYILMLLELYLIKSYYTSYLLVNA